MSEDTENTINNVNILRQPRGSSVPRSLESFGFSRIKHKAATSPPPASSEIFHLSPKSPSRKLKPKDARAFPLADEDNGNPLDGDSMPPIGIFSTFEASFDHEHTLKQAILNADETSTEDVSPPSQEHKDIPTIVRFCSDFEASRRQKTSRSELYSAPSREMLRPYLRTFFMDVPTSPLLPKSMLDLEVFYFALEECGSLNESRGISTIFCRVRRPIELMTGLSIDVFFLQSILHFLHDVLSVEPWIVIHEGRRTLSWIIKGAGSMLLSGSETSTTLSNVFADKRTLLRTRLLNELHKTYSASLNEAVELSSIIAAKAWPASFCPDSSFPTVESLPRKDLPGIQGYSEIKGSTFQTTPKTMMDARSNDVIQNTPLSTEPKPKPKLSLLERVCLYLIHHFS